MIHPDEALNLLRSFKRTPRCEEVAISDALYRILPQKIISEHDQPPFDKSAMDGWAWKQAGIDALPAAPLGIRGTIAAGSPGEPGLKQGECDRIMTGAPIPQGANRVQRVEWSTESNGFVTFSKQESESNIIGKGENSSSGSVILQARLLGAQDIAILAADGRKRVSVAVKPRIHVFSTGAELSEAGTTLGKAMIYDSNRPQILAQLGGMPCVAVDRGILRDDFDGTKDALKTSVDACDILILSGGVSMGDFDFVPSALKASGVRELFHGVAMKPGKPTFFGKSETSFAFGLPGNPVSVFVNMELFVKPLIAALCGIDYFPPVVPCPLAQSIKRRNAERVEFLPVRFSTEGVEAVPYGGSSALQALAGADGFIRLEIGELSLDKGSIAHVRLVR